MFRQKRAPTGAFFVYADTSIRTLKKNALLNHIEYIKSKNLDSNDDHWKEIKGCLDDNMKTAIYTFNGPLLYSCLKFLKENQFVIPKDIGLVGYDDESWGALMGPGITGIEQNLVEIGFQAMDKLLKNIEKKDSSIEITTVKSKLIKRDSL